MIGPLEVGSRTFGAVAIAVILLLGLQVPAQMEAVTQPPDPLKHIVVIVQENHSFDNYFGTFPGANGIPAGTEVPVDPNDSGSVAITPFHENGSLPISIVGDELPPGVSDPSELNSSGSVTPFHMPASAEPDVNAAWSAAHMAYDGGKMDGFVYAQDYFDLNGTVALGYYDRSDIPYYWDYASNYVLADNFYSSLMGPSLPNHLYIASGTSGGIIGDSGETLNAGGVGVGALNLTWATLAQDLTADGVSWAWYTGDSVPVSGTVWNVLPLFSYFQSNFRILETHDLGTQDFVNSLTNGSLPAVSWITPGAWRPAGMPEGCDGIDVSEHPPALPACGMDYVTSLVNDVMNSQYWKDTAIIVTWDDWGGFYDHVPPPTIDAYGEGFRVPTLIISPFAKHGFVDNTEYEFGSTLKLIESVFNAPSLGARDLQANNMLDAFDFAQSPQPPLIEPADFVPGMSAPALSNGYTVGTTSGSGGHAISGFSYIALAIVAGVVVAAFVGAAFAFRRRRSPGAAQAPRRLEG